MSAPAAMPPTSDISFAAGKAPVPSFDAGSVKLVGQSWQTTPLGQPHHRLQPAVRDQVRVIERG
ncbi:hypothetical protein H1V43_38155 [Streptomyces sp. PSKA54]|uniref:Uncharacterized protein n=1 Tax=Streptomyces himalayensis subsp. aureolus TaxID=2758039 RepID=A0A7W2D923_9ACTN|nr:hypothetical protein [Streptomyces himalayensis]MBA4867019.1 hypothetical protein [Streptomyces himalayensis subsp. aureolus]